MSEIKLDIPDITVLIDKGDEYKVIVNKPGSVVKNITGSFITIADTAISSSYALTASYAANAGGGTGVGFPYSGSAVITGSLLVSQSGITVTGSVNISDNLTVLGTINAEELIVSSSVIYSSGSTKFGDSSNDTHQFTGSVIVDGPINASKNIQSTEYKIKAGDVSLTFTGSVTSGIFGATEFIYPFLPTSSFCATTVEYVASRPGGLRVGNILAGWSGSETTVTDISTTDVGDTSDIRFSLVQDSGYIKLRVESLGNGTYPWTVQSLFKLFPVL